MLRHMEACLQAKQYVESQSQLLKKHESFDDFDQKIIHRRKRLSHSQYAILEIEF